MWNHRSLISFYILIILFWITHIPLFNLWGTWLILMWSSVAFVFVLLLYMQKINVMMVFDMALTRQSLSCSCGSCGYELNLSSCNRNTSTIGSKYGKSIKTGIISFFNIDESRFTQVDEIQCIPHLSKRTWGLIRRRTKLLCRKCGNQIGIAYNDYTSSHPLVSDGLDSSSGNEVLSRRKYDVKIRTLQPSSSEEFGVPHYIWYTWAKLVLYDLFLSKYICNNQAKNFLPSLFI